MSRAPIPGSKQKTMQKSWRQICAYAFPRTALQSFSSCNTKTPLEKIEDIEILRFLELGFEVQMIPMSDQSISVDDPRDIQKVEKALKNRLI